MLRRVEIREPRDEDVGGIVRLLREANPHQLISEVSLRHRLASTPPQAKQRRWVAVDAGEVVAAAGGQLHVYAETVDTGFVGATVRAGRRGRGVGGDLFERALAHVRDAGAMRALAEAGVEEGRSFLERRGFTRTNVRRYSRVDPRAVDFSGLAELRELNEREGFTVAPFTQCRPEDIYQIDRETTRDVPLPVSFTDMPLDDWMAQNWHHPQLTLEGSFAVLHDGRPVTFTYARADGDRASNDMTATRRPFRGRGLARLVKLCQLEWSAQNEIASVVTENDATNAPMLAVNSRLGYRPFHEVSTYTRERL
jgi:GNAT superfamily N-acetyltransferase